MITLDVRDLARAAQFYEDGLGLPRMGSLPEVAISTLNGTWLGLYERTALAQDVAVSSEGSEFKLFALAHNVPPEVKVEEVVAQAARAGATAVKQPERVFGRL